MARHPISAMTRAIIAGVLMVAVVAPPATAADAKTRGDSVPFGKSPSRVSPQHRGRVHLASEPFDVQPSAGFADEYSPATSLDAAASASVDESASEDVGDGEEAEDGPEKIKSSGTLLAVPSGETEIAAGTGFNNDTTTGASTAYAEESDGEDSKALFVVSADPVSRVTAKTNRSAALAEKADGSDTAAPAPEANAAGDADDADTPGPTQELFLDQETPAEAPKESHVNSTSEASAPAPAPSTAMGETPAADAPAASGLKPVAASERSNAAAGDDDEESSDAGDADPAVEEKHEKKQSVRGNETGDAGAVEAGEDAPAPASEERVAGISEGNAEVAAASQDPAPEPEEEDLLAPGTSSPPPPVVGTMFEHADDTESDAARAGRRDNGEEVTPSWRDTASAPEKVERAGVAAAGQLEIVVGNPVTAESVFEHALPIVLGGCSLFVVGAMVYSHTRRARGKARGAVSGAGKARAAGENSTSNESWFDEEGGWRDDGERGKRRGSPVSAEKWAAEESAWSDDERFGDGKKDGWR